MHRAIVDRVREAELAAALAASRSSAESFGLPVDDVLVLHNSNRVTLRLLPCEVLVRVSPAARQVAEFELELTRLLTRVGGPVGRTEPRVPARVHLADGFAITFWTYYPTLGTEPTAVDYADALARLHAGLRQLDIEAPHFTERVDEAGRLVADPGSTPALADADRELLADALRDLRHEVCATAAEEQLLHGEPHPGNVLATDQGPLFVDLETCCRGPVAFDVAHARDDVGEHYPGIDRGLLRSCRLLHLAMITTWRWDRDDEFPDGHRLGREWLDQLRNGLRDRPAR